MRKVILLVHVSLDGFMAGVNGEMDWIVYNKELERYSHDLIGSLDTSLYGRVTYQMMESYWPTVPGNPTSSKEDVEYAEWLNQAEKIVFSRTLDKVTWQNSRIVKDDIAGEIARLKQKPGKNMIMIGSPGLVQTFVQQNLIDEYRINVNPIILGSGKPLFAGMDHIQPLKLLEARKMEGGVVALRYEPAAP